MVYLILALLAIWLLFTIIGLVIDGLIWLTIIGALLFLATTVWGWLQNKQRT